MDFFKNRIYLDYVSSTPLDTGMLGIFPRIPPEALMANASALHKEGQSAKKILAEARAVAAKTLSAHADEIIFTSNATESDNLALQGAVQACLKQDIAADSIVVMTTDSEHSAVLETVKALSKDIAVTIITTEKTLLNPKDIIVPEQANVLILSVIYVNNETGVVQDIQAIAKRVRFLRKHHPDTIIIFHVDATQAPLHYSLDVRKLGADMLTLGATKLYCPKGVGLLYVKRGTPLVPLMYGGGQEHGLRPGTQPVRLIHDFAYALQYAQSAVEEYSAKILDLQGRFESSVLADISQAVITAADMPRAPHISHLAFKGFDSELLVLELDARGIAVSAKSACKNEETNESDIVERIYGQGWGAVRFSFGRMTTPKDIKKAVAALAAVLEKYR